MFSKDWYQHNELIMRSRSFLPQLSLDLPKLETCKVDTWMSPTFGHLCSATLESAFPFTLWWLHIPSANDVVLSPEAFKYVRHFTLKGIQGIVEVIHRYYSTAVEVLCEEVVLFVLLRNSKDVALLILFVVIVLSSMLISHYWLRWIGSNGRFRKKVIRKSLMCFAASCLTRYKHLKEKGTTIQQVKGIRR